MLLAVAAPLVSGGRVKAAPQSGLATTLRDSSQKVTGSTLVVDGEVSEVELDVARNETVSFQLVMRSTDGRRRQVGVEVLPATGVQGAIMPSLVELSLVHYFTIEKPSDAFGSTGRWPDPLIPFSGSVTVGPDAPTVVWVKVNIPRGQPPGRYSGTIMVSADDGGRREVSWSLMVHGVILPDDPTLPFMVGLDWESIARWEVAGMGREAAERTLLPNYFAALRLAGTSLFNPFDRIQTFRPGSPFDFGPVDRRLREVVGDAKATPVAVPFSLGGPIDPRQNAPFTDSWSNQVRAYLQEVGRHYQDTGLIDRAFIYVAEADEPIRQAQVASITQLQRLVAQADPRLKFVQTIHARCYDCDRPALTALDSSLTQWCPNIAFYDGNAVGLERTLTGQRIHRVPSGWPGGMDRDVRASGRSVWWYLNAATGVLDPSDQLRYPSLHIDHDGMAHRVLGWMAWEQRIAAVGYWMATYWRGQKGPWDAVPRGEGGAGTNGDGVLLYPGRGAPSASGQVSGPVTSIRFEMIRESGADHKLLTLAERKLGREFVRTLTRRVHDGLTKFSLDPQPMRSARTALLAELSR